MHCNAHYNEDNALQCLSFRTESLFSHTTAENGLRIPSFYHNLTKKESKVRDYFGRLDKIKQKREF